MTDKLAQIEAAVTGRQTVPRYVTAGDVLALVEIARAAQDMVDYAAPIPMSELVRRKDALAAAVARMKENE